MWLAVPLSPCLLLEGGLLCIIFIRFTSFDVLGLGLMSSEGYLQIDSLKVDPLKKVGPR
jgi:hypothetical protein